MGANLCAMIGITFSYLGTQGRFFQYIGNSQAFIFVAGTILNISSYMMMSISIVPLFSKIIRPQSRLFMMPWQSAFLAAGRIVSPLWCDYAWELQEKENSEYLFGSLMIIYTLAVGIATTYWWYLQENIWKVL